MYKMHTSPFCYCSAEKGAYSLNILVTFQVVFSVILVLTQDMLQLICVTAC